MAVTRIGHGTPADYAQGDANLHYAYNDGTGMCAEVTECSDGIGYIVETWNDDVGLTTYWRAETLEEAASFADTVTAPESEEDYALACDAQHAANPHRFEGEL